MALNSTSCTSKQIPENCYADSVNVRSIATDTLSFFRTQHEFEKYAEFHSLDEFQEYCTWAVKNNTNLYILGNGSNTLFGSKRVKTLILKNNLPKGIEKISEEKVRVSSSTLVIEVLKYCYQNSLDSFYYLASVPATIGGALAMNAGRGKAHNLTIYDFVESVDVFDFSDKKIKTLCKQDIVKGHRSTIFTGIQSSLILQAVLKFDKTAIQGNPIIGRCKWSKENQDYSGPNCGSVFREADASILDSLKGFSFGGASFSRKTRNWILSHSKKHLPILVLIKIAEIIHVIKKRKSSLEVIIVK